MRIGSLLAIILFTMNTYPLWAQQGAIPLTNASVKGIAVYGKPVDNQTRCVHWHSPLDIIAIKFYCCDQYFPCYSCHEETADHAATVWPKKEFDKKAILCGVCGHELTVNEYMQCNNNCPKCNSPFNPGCKNHYHLYFETE
ncbi:MAG: chromophore lyase [Cyclobacteriaceae bacterium]|nr:chromophore lyase [Cyclobacteriaceae bacterium]